MHHVSYGSSVSSNCMAVSFSTRDSVRNGARATMAVELPIEITVIVNVKVGQPFSNSRSTYGSPFETRLIVSEGYDVFRQKILRHLSQLNEVRWEEHSPILYRPVSNAPQSKFEPLATEDADFQHQLQRVWRLAGRRRDGYGTYCVLR
jgi:hypothetical protein